MYDKISMLLMFDFSILLYPECTLKCQINGGPNRQDGQKNFQNLMKGELEFENRL